MAQSSSLRLTLEAPARIRSGKPVPLVFRVTNAGRQAVTLPVMGRTPTADFVVTDSRGRPLWSRLRGQTMLGSLLLYPLLPGKSLTFREQWDQRTDTGALVSPGEYQVRGILITDAPGGLPSPTATVRIES